MNTQINLIVDGNNQVIKAKADDQLICNVWKYTDNKEECMNEARAAIFTEMCRLTQLGHTLTVSENHF